MGFAVTGALAAVFLGATVFCGWRGAQKPKLLAAPRLAPWRVLMLICFVALLAMLLHLVTLFKAH